MQLGEPAVRALPEVDAIFAAYGGLGADQHGRALFGEISVWLDRSALVDDGVREGVEHLFRAIEDETYRWFDRQRAEA